MRNPALSFFEKVTQSVWSLPFSLPVTNTEIDISLQETLARDRGSHSLVLFTAPTRPQASATIEQTALQVHGLCAKMGCKSEQRKKGL